MAGGIDEGDAAVGDAFAVDASGLALHRPILLSENHQRGALHVGQTRFEFCCVVVGIAGGVGGPYGGGRDQHQDLDIFRVLQGVAQRRVGAVGYAHQAASSRTGRRD